MANALYPLGKEGILDGTIDLQGDDIRAALIDTADETYNAADEFYSDLTGAGIIGVTANLTGKTFTNGVFDADNAVVTAATGDPVEAIVLYQWTGSGATSRLIGWFDISTYTPSGLNANIAWNGSGIFAI